MKVFVYLTHLYVDVLTCMLLSLTLMLMQMYSTIAFMVDFYMMDSGLGMVQTSLGVMNNTLLDLITPHSLLAWQRVRVASAIAKTGEEWYTTFKTHASGT